MSVNGVCRNMGCALHMRLVGIMTSTCRRQVCVTGRRGLSSRVM